MQVLLTFRLIGVRPLLMRCGRLADPLDPSAQAVARLAAKRPKTPTDLAAIAEAEWYGGLWLSEGRPCLPAQALEACVVEAARTRRLGKTAAAAVSCTSHAIVEHDGPADLDSLWKNPDFRLRTGVDVARHRVFRTRPRFSRWAATVTVEILPNLLEEAMALDLFRIAGAQIGIGDWRPRYGRFRAEILDVARHG